MRATSSSSPGPELMSFQRYFSSFLDSQLALYSLAPLLVMLCYANNHSNSKLHHQQRPSIGSCLRFPLQLHGRLPLRLYHHRWRHHTLVFHPDWCQRRPCWWNWCLGILWCLLPCSRFRKFTIILVRGVILVFTLRDRCHHNTCPCYHSCTWTCCHCCPRNLPGCVSYNLECIIVERKYSCLS